MFCKAQSSNTSEINTTIINEIHKISYIQCIINTSIELNDITSRIKKDMQLVIDFARSKIKIIHDAENTANRILAVLESSEENINTVRFNFLNTYQSWLDDCLKISNTLTKTKISETDAQEKDVSESRIEEHEHIVELEDSSSSELEIVNEIKYLNSYRDIIDDEDAQISKTSVTAPSKKQSETNDISNLNTECVPDESLLISDNDSVDPINDNKNEQSGQKDCTNSLVSLVITSVPEILNKNNINNSHNSKRSNNNETNTKELFESDSDKASDSINDSVKSNFQNRCSIESDISQDQIVKSNRLDLKRTPHVLDEKLRLKCGVQVEHLSMQVLNKYRKVLNQSRNSVENKIFQRLINLKALENKRNKRHYISSDSACTDNSNSLTIKSFKIRRKNSKKLKLSLAESEISSFYATSDENSSNNDVCTDDTNINRLNKEILDQNEERLKQQLLKTDDSSEDFLDDDDDDDGDDDKDSNSNHECEKTKRTRVIVSTDSDSSSTNNENSRSKWLKDKLLTFTLSDLECNEKQKSKKRILIEKNESGSSSDSVHKPVSIKKKHRTKEIINCVQSETSSDTDIYLSSSDDCQIINGDSQVPENNNIITDIQLLNSSVKSGGKPPGRRNIRKLLEDQQIAEDTKQAVKDEENRLQRLADRKQQLEILFNGEISKNETLVLDFDIETKKELVIVDKGLVKYLKPHQEEGVKFMWDCCFETLARAKSTEGSGCILAHCMGLGKTFQIITLVHTLLTNKATGVNTVMVMCPMNTILNWVDEFDMWLKNVKNEKKIRIYELTQIKKLSSRLTQLNLWHQLGGVLIISYDMFRSFTSHKRKLNPKQIKKMKYYLINPGADLVACDEGHLLKNEDSLLADKIQSIRTKRRIVLTGTPLQNNLREYHCMVQFVKPNLLGTKEEFQNRFSNPITNGQFDNSTPQDVKLMKHRAHVLHRMLKGCVQRCDYAVLTPFLPPKQEYVILIRLSELQMEMYKHYIDNITNVDAGHCSLFKNYQEIKQLIAHPKTMHLKAQTKTSRTKRNNYKDNMENSTLNVSDHWWSKFIKDEHLQDITISYKLILLFAILEKCEKEGDKLLVFSQCLYTLDVIEIFLEKIDTESRKDNSNWNLFNFQGEWKCDFDYFRLDGTVKSDKRNSSCKTFNDPANKRARLFLISTKAGGLGINLIGANRVIVFDPSWNPSNDVQSIFRVFRFGQKKPCYIYRFLTAGTMEEKIYNRQVTKLSLSLRVLDEQQIKRHYRDTDLAELYKFEPLNNDVPILNLPKDHVLADVFLKYTKYVYNFFEHDSLLENKEEEELDEEERKQAWFEYQQEKLVQQNTDTSNKGKGKVNQRKRVLDKNLETKVSENLSTNDVTLDKVQINLN